ncbi:MAG: exo-alpha-sialidase, partial [Candidatus Aenigmarchaeota archaeon]|nr:exo-alpha-sialidase [Candidatus Aenigmarchaeota archaeon]
MDNDYVIIDSNLGATPRWEFSNHKKVCSTSDGVVHVVWSLNDGSWKTYYANSSDGLTFNSKLLMYEGGRAISIACDEKNVAVVYHNNATYLSGYLGMNLSTNSGSSWSVLNPDKQMREEPDIWIRGQRIYVVYTDEDTYNLTLVKSTDLGSGWETVHNMGENKIGEEPNIYVDGIGDGNDKIHVVFGQGTEGRYYVNSTDGGDTWGSRITLFASGNSAQYPAITGSGNNLYAITDSTLGIRYRNSSNGGSTWSTEATIRSGTSRSFISLNNESRPMVVFAESGYVKYMHYNLSNSWSEPTTLMYPNSQYPFINQKYLNNRNDFVWYNSDDNGYLYYDKIQYDDTKKPTYSHNSTNSTYAGQDILHSLRWEDEGSLSGYIFSFDNGTG